jgi:hypothetical protein
MRGSFAKVKPLMLQLAGLRPMSKARRTCPIASAGVYSRNYSATVSSSATKTLYDHLEVDKNASEDEITKAFNRLSLNYHPDMIGNDPERVKKFKEISDAREILTNPERRRHYDMTGSEDRQHTISPAEASTKNIPETKDIEEKSAKTPRKWKLKLFLFTCVFSTLYYQYRKSQKEKFCKLLEDSFLGADETEIVAMSKKAKLTKEDIMLAAKNITSLQAKFMPPDVFGMLVVNINELSIQTNMY